jgi:anthranilate phosphoribosyltransferase
MEMREILNRLFEHKTLNHSEAREILTNIAQGKYSDSEIAAFMTIFLMRSITVEELAGFRDALLELCVKVDFNGFDTIDVCGTGGDGKDTINISTLSTFIIAGAGAKVAKHGNYGVSSGCGSSNILEQLGYKFTNDVDQLKRSIENSGVSYMHAPLFNPAMKNVAPVRKALKVKTFFNLIGPIVNPSFPKKQMVGVYSLEVARIYNYLFQQDKKQFAIIHSLDGYDEISLTSDFKLLSNQSNKIISPEELGMERVKAEDIRSAKSIPEAAQNFLDILEGKGNKAQTNVVLVNSAFALQCYYPGKELAECMEMAKESLDSKKAIGALKKLLG